MKVSPEVAGIGLRMARADMDYVHPAFLRPATRWLFMQHGSVVAFEARAFLRNQMGYAPEAWKSGEVSAASRHSVKYLGDQRRPHDEALPQFEAIIEANRSAFFPARRVRILDRLRDDLSIILVDERPVQSNIGGYFGGGVGTNPSVAAEWRAAGTYLHDVGYDVGQVVAALEGDADPRHVGPRPCAESRITWTDSKSSRVYSAMFDGGLTFGLAGLLSTVTFGLIAADGYARTDCCASCAFAARKQRIIALWHGVESLKRLTDPRLPVPLNVRVEVQAILQVPVVREVDEKPWRRLRNGLVHLGLSDLPVNALPSDVDDLDVVVEAYLGRSAAEADALLDRALAEVAERLESWCARPPPGEPSYRDLLRRVRV